MSANPLYVSRRTFVGGLVIALGLPACSSKDEASVSHNNLEASAWLRIGTDHSITFQCDRSEMGQGVYTSLAMLSAQELRVVLQKIKVEFSPPRDQFHTKL